MKKYAIVKDGLVVNLNEYESQPTTPPPGFEDGYEAIQSNIAGPGFTYTNGVFTAPQPFPSWTLVGNVWTPPVPMPNTGKPCYWDEAVKNWVSL